MSQVFHYCTVAVVLLSSARLFAVENERVSKQGSEIVSRLRRPNAVAVIGEMVFVANRASGSVTVMELAGRSVVQELDVGRGLSDIVACADGRSLLTTDEVGGQLVVLSFQDGELRVCRRVDVSPHPVTLSISPSGKWCVVASLWSRQLTILDVASLLSDETSPLTGRPTRTVDLQIAPRTQCWLRHDRLVVADSFGGELNILDAPTARVVGRIAVDGHNIRGLALNVDKTELFITHQILNGHEPTERSRVFWGDVMGNLLRSVSVAYVHGLCEEPARGGHYEVPGLRRIAHWTLHPLGEPGNAAGDPSAILVNAAGKTAILLSGTGEIALRPGDHKVFTRRDVGKRPIAGALTIDGKTAIVANHFDDSISLVSLDDKRVLDTISLGPQPPLTSAQQGETLFYDARLSLDNWYSCHSCHTDGHTNGRLNDNFSDGSYGAPKRVLSLLGVAHTKPWAWNGGQDSLRDQVATSIQITMQGKDANGQRERHAESIAAYLRTLEPPPALNRQRQALDDRAVERGRLAFANVGCTECHQPGTYTSDDVFDMQATDSLSLKNATTAEGGTHFNPPSLLGLSQRTRLLHNGSARNVAEVFAKSKHGDLIARLSAKQRRDLEIFLSSL